MIVATLVLLAAAAALALALWNALAWPRVAPAGREAPRGAVSVLVPARDEEANIAGCLEAALAQGDAVGEVLVYDDHSSDATAAIVDAFARRDGRVRRLAPSALPDGWCGKSFACAKLGEAARGEWLLFLDADARLGRDAASRLAGEGEARSLDLLSAWPALEARGLAEKTLMPMLNFVVFTLFPAPLSLARDDASLGLAHGACLLVRRATYLLEGGHAAVWDQVFEDVRLATAWRERGHRTLCLDGRGVVSVRMYRSFAEIWRGFQKNFYPAFRRDASFWAFMALHAAVFFLPVVLAPFVPFGGAGALVWASALCVLAARFALAVRFGTPLWPVLLHPVGEAVLLALGLSSWWRCRTGRGVEWKGRRYRAGARAAER